MAKPIDGLHAEQIVAHQKLDRQLRRRFRQIKHTIAPKDLKGCGGTVLWEAGGNGTVEIEWDPFQYDLLWLTIHEALHPPLIGPLSLVGDLEEGGVVGITDAHCKYVRHNARRRAWWRKAIKERMTTEGFRRWLMDQ